MYGRLIRFNVINYIKNINIKKRSNMKVFHSILTNLCLLSLLVSCSNGSEQRNQIPSVKVDTVCSNGEKSFLQYPGRVKAAQDVDLAFRVSGTIQKLYVTEGASVKAGQLLAEMDPSDYQIQLAATEAKYKQIKAEAERVIALFKDGGSTPNDYDKAVYGLKQIEALYKHHQDELAYTKLYAPFDGFIQKRFFESHETVGAGMPVLSMLGKGTPEVEINLPAAEYIRRDFFSHYHCTFDIYPGNIYPLQLIGITHKANANQLYNMRFKLEVGDRPLPSAGMNTMVSVFYTDGDDHTLQVPTTALLHADGQVGVFVYQPSSQSVKHVSVTCVRPLSNGCTIITSDELHAGDVIVTAGIHTLKDGNKVRPLAPISNTNIGGLL